MNDKKNKFTRLDCFKRVTEAHVPYDIEGPSGRKGMTEIIFVVESAVEGGFTARALGESIFTEGEDLDEIRTNIRDAVDCHFDQTAKPKVIRLHFVTEEVLAA